MRRKQGPASALINSSEVIPDAPPSPNPTGAMDSLLEKLRAAAPSTRDTRDRRRRARLNDRHQKRVASGQQIPDLPGIETSDTIGTEPSLLSPPSETSDPASTEKESGATSEGEDVADRAASLLQGLRGDAEGDGLNRDDSLRIRRRRESADDERVRRRRRRTAKDSVESASTNPPQTPILEESGENTEAAFVLPEISGEGLGINTDFLKREDSPSELPSPPITVIVPPSPTTSERAAAEDHEAGRSHE